MKNRLDDYRTTYQQMLDAELLEQARQKDSLTPEARVALWAELGRRGIAEELAEAPGPPAPAESPDRSQQKWVCVFSASGELEAQFIQGLLEAAGIESSSYNQDSLGVLPLTVGGRNAIAVLVPEPESKRALQIISEQLETERDSE